MKRIYKGKEYNPPRITVGGATLLMIFAIMCLTVFAALSVSTALMEKASVELYAKTTREYYEADLKAREILRSFEDVYLEKKSAEDLIATADAMGIHLDIGNDMEGKIYSYNIPLNDKGSILAVEFMTADNGLKLISFTQEETSKWVPNEDLDLIIQ